MLKYLTAITLFDVAGDFVQSTAVLPICRLFMAGLLPVLSNEPSGE
jgi:hypothetical protein